MFVRPMICRAPDDGGAGAAPAATPPAAGAPASESLFDAAGAEPPTTATPPAATPPAATPPAEDKPGRPEYLSEQFWDPEAGQPRVKELAQSWTDLRRQISRGDHKPPATAEAYTLPKVEGLPEGLVGGADDTLWPQLRSAAHAAGLTQQQMEKMATPFLQAVAEQVRNNPAATPEQVARLQEAEIAKLGPNGRQLIRDVGGYINGLHARGVLSDAERQALRASATSAEAVRALAKLRELSGEQPIPTTALEDGSMAQADAERMMREGFSENDDAKVARARARLEELDRTGRLIAPR